MSMPKRAYDRDRLEVGPPCQTPVYCYVGSCLRAFAQLGAFAQLAIMICLAGMPDESALQIAPCSR